MLEIAILCLIFMFPATFAMTMLRWSKPPISVKRKRKDKNGQYKVTVKDVQPSLTPKEAILCCPPLLSAMVIWKAMFQKYSWTAVVSVIATLGIIFRVVVVFATQDPWLFVISFWVFWASILLIHIMYIMVYTSISVYFSLGIFNLLLCIVLPYGAAAFMKTKVPRVMQELNEEEDDKFKGR